MKAKRRNGEKTLDSSNDSISDDLKMIKEACQRRKKSKSKLFKIVRRDSFDSRFTEEEKQKLKDRMDEKFGEKDLDTVIEQTEPTPFWSYLKRDSNTAKNLCAKAEGYQIDIDMRSDSQATEGLKQTQQAKPRKQRKKWNRENKENLIQANNNNIASQKYQDSEKITEHETFTFENKSEEEKRVQTKGPFRRYMKPTESRIAKSKTSTDNQSSLSEETNNYHNRLRKNTKDAIEKEIKLKNDNPRARSLDDSQYLKNGVFVARKMPNFGNQQWRPHFGTKKITKVKPFTLLTEKRAKSARVDDLQRRGKHCMISKKSTKMPTIPVSPKLLTQERSKMR
ncbi:unnamed protein product [Moneuplotes crassus]|uniref:Uncharacterized protein n=1 Tax=Euplotes crassus TaxID=5936 RepID=A0AAD1X9J2_EUPCR|nr:unnamed protein product [Moneuplotes crassus]